MFDASILAFAFAALLLTVTPGPDTFLVIGSTARGGVRRGIAATLGITTGGLFYMALFGFGVAQVLVHSPTVFWTVKLCGAVYLLYLGIAALRSAMRPRTIAPQPEALPAAAASHRRAWLQGLITNAVNPKVAVFYLAFLPQFMAPGDPIAAKSMLLIGIHYAIGLVWLSLVALWVDRFRGWLARPAVARTLDGIVGAAMTAFGLRLALASR